MRLRYKKRILLLLGLLFIIGCFFISCSKKDSYEKYSITNFSAFNTVSEISAYDIEDQTENLDILNQLLEEWNQLFDIYQLYDGINNIKTINDCAGKAAVEVDERIISVIEKGIELETVTKGNCNIAFGSVLSIWHYYREEGLADENFARLPSKKQLKLAAKHTDISNIVIDKEKHTIFLKDSKMSLDVGAIAKGYVADAIAQKAKELAMDSVIINLGGNVLTVGNKKDKKEESDWIAGIRNPDDGNNDSYLYKLSLNDMALVTSGDYQRFYLVDGKRYSHIIDPITLFPANHYRSVTIYGKNSGTADALSTALFIADLEKGKQILMELDDEYEAVWILQDGSVEMTDGIKKLLR